MTVSEIIIGVNSNQSSIGANYAPLSSNTINFGVKP